MPTTEEWRIALDGMLKRALAPLEARIAALEAAREIVDDAAWARMEQRIKALEVVLAGH
jgi:hypothetical protein